MLCSPIQNHTYPSGNLTAKARYFSVTRADQISCPLRSPNFLQGAVLRIIFHQGELFISPRADVGGQGMIIVPEIRVRPVGHGRATLEGLCVSGFVVGQSALNAIVYAPGVKIGLK